MLIGGNYEGKRTVASSSTTINGKEKKKERGRRRAKPTG